MFNHFFSSRYKNLFYPSAFILLWISVTFVLTVCSVPVLNFPVYPADPALACYSSHPFGHFLCCILCLFHTQFWAVLWIQPALLYFYWWLLHTTSWISGADFILESAGMLSALSIGTFMCFFVNSLLKVHPILSCFPLILSKTIILLQLCNCLHNCNSAAPNTSKTKPSDHSRENSTDHVCQRFKRVCKRTSGDSNYLRDQRSVQGSVCSWPSWGAMIRLIPD